MEDRGVSPVKWTARIDAVSAGLPTWSARLTFAIAVREGSSLVYRGRGDQVFVLNPDGESLDDALHAVELGGASAEVYLISTNTTGDTTSPRIAPVGVPARTLRGAEAARASGWRPPSPPAPDRPWVTEFNANPPLGRPGPPAERRQGLLRGRQARDTVAEGDTFTFLDVVEVPATARAVVTDGAKTAAVWVADRDWGTCEECVSQEMADAIADRFLGPGAGNDIHDWITAYLARTYGGAELFGAIVRSELAGVAAIEGALRALGHGVSFGDVLTDWAVATLLSDNTGAPARYRYNAGTWSDSQAGGLTFRLGSINLYHYVLSSHAGRLRLEGPYLHSIEAFNEREQPPHSNTYATLGRTSGPVRMRVSADAGNRITVVIKE